MKHLIFILLGFFIWNSALSQTRTSNFQLPQWSTGDTLKAGTANDTTRANFSLNNGFARLDAILGARIDSTGRFIDILGAGTGNLIINSGSLGGTASRVVLADSLYGTFNWQTTANALIGGNLFVGGYVTTDSLLLGAGVIDADNLYARGNIVAQGYVDVDTVQLGGGGVPGVLSVAGVGAFADNAYLKYLGSALVSVNIPALTASDTLVTMNGAQNLYTYLGHYGQSGVATVGAGDSVQVTFSGFTSSGIVMLTYEGGNTAYTKIPVVGYKRTNGFTIYADASYNVAWFVVKK